MSLNDIHWLLRRSLFFSQNSAIKKFKNKYIALLFFENSTRTKVSFEIAAKELGFETIDFNLATSSMNKGETLLETLKTIKMMGVEVAIIRHSDDHLIEQVALKSPVQIINAGSGKIHHPSQALLDLHTIFRSFNNLEDLNIHISGDIKYSRVANSHFQLWEKIGAQVSISGPKDLLPKKIDPSFKIQPIDLALQQSDVSIFLRVQKERHEQSDLNFENYNNDYGLNNKRLKMLKPNSIILHPGPFNLGVEITQDVLDDSRCRIYHQLRNSVFMRMAILDWLIEER